MKILIAATSIDTFSGASKCLIELANGLLSKGFSVIVALPSENGDLKKELEKNNIEYVCFHEYGSWYIECHKKHNLNTIFSYIVKRIFNYVTIYNIKKYLKGEEIDIVHVNASTAYTVGYAAIQLGIPVVWHLREMLEEDLGIELYNRKFSLKILNKANQFIAISNVVKNKWQKLLDKPIDVIYDGLPVNNYYIEKKDDIKEFNVLIYGRIVPGKGQLFFIKGIHRILNECKDNTNFLIAGIPEDKQYFDQCMNYVSKNKLNSIKYIGEIKDIKRLLQKTNIVCVCSTMEGFGRVTIESQLGKCLVLGADSGGTVELIKDGLNGFLYKSGDLDDFSKKLLYLIKNYSSLYSILEEGQSNAYQKFSFDRNLDAICDVYYKIKDNTLTNILE